MTALWSAEEAARATGGHIPHGADWRAQGVSIDTRTVAHDDLFVALKGPRFDGHDFVEAALTDGAAAAMIDRPLPHADPARLLAVPDTQAGLEALARAARDRSAAKVVAVTGSVGKTGTKEALATLLSRQGATHASSGNLNNQIGLPLSLARMPAASRFGVFEIGMNHAGEIAPLSAILRPHVAIITTVEAVHLEYFPNIEAIADAKAEIFAGMTDDGAAILNRDNAQFARLAAAAKAQGIGRIWAFGTEPDCEAHIRSLSLDADGSTVAATVRGRDLAFRLPLPGRHHVQNALAILLAVTAVGGDTKDAAAALAELAPVKGRGVASEIAIAGGSFTLIDETYNASPVAVRAALGVLGMMSPKARGRRIVVLGDMLELGESSPAEHAGLAESAAANGIDLVLTGGPLMRHLHDALPKEIRGAHAENAAALAPQVAAAVAPGDIVMVKGSAGSKMSAVVAALKNLADPSEDTRRAV